MFDCDNTHNQILFRNTSFENNESFLNQDLLIVGVFYLGLPYNIDGFTVRHASKTEITSVLEKIPKNCPSWKKIFIFESCRKDYFVVADRIMFQENISSNTSIPSRLENTINDEQIAQIVANIRNENYETNIKRIQTVGWEVFK